MELGKITENTGFFAVGERGEKRPRGFFEGRIKLSKIGLIVW